MSMYIEKDDYVVEGFTVSRAMIQSVHGGTTEGWECSCWETPTA